MLQYTSADHRPSLYHLPCLPPILRSAALYQALHQRHPLLGASLLHASSPRQHPRECLSASPSLSWVVNREASESPPLLQAVATRVPVVPSAGTYNSHGNSDRSESRCRPPPQVPQLPRAVPAEAPRPLLGLAHVDICTRDHESTSHFGSPGTPGLPRVAPCLVLLAASPQLQFCPQDAALHPTVLALLALLAVWTPQQHDLQASQDDLQAYQDDLQASQEASQD